MGIYDNIYCMKLTLLIPAYNEEDILENTLKEVTRYLKKQKYSWEVLVVDDGSSDNTSKITKDFNSKYVRLKKLSQNRGKGGAIREGIKDSKGDYIVFSDADLSVPINTIEKFMEFFDSGSEVVIGSRRIPGATIAIAQPAHRELMGRVFTFISKVMTGVFISDFTCGFKGFEKKAAREIFKRSMVDRWAYDSEIIFLADQLGYKIDQVPVTWENREDTRVRLRGVVFETLKDLLRIRLHHAQKGYNIK
jgi:dolichyl-phosphate beta-glucosyltransferase